jgi:hypothetical protein
MWSGGRRSRRLAAAANGERKRRAADHVGRGAHLSALEISRRARDLVAPAIGGPTCRQDPEIFVFLYLFWIGNYCIFLFLVKNSSLKINEIIWSSSSS